MLIEERSTQTLRLSVLKWTLTTTFVVLAVCFWYLQVAQHTRFLETAENNHRRTLALDAPRGVVFDRGGRLLVENRYARNISIVRDQAHDLERTSDLLANVTGTSPDAIREALARNRGVPNYRPVVVIRDATLAQVAAVMAHRYELPNAVVEQVPVREYPAHAAAAHVLGYVGEVSELQLTRQKDAGLRLGDIIGQTGLERQYNRLLMGNAGAQFVRVNSLGREVRVDRTVDPVSGRRVQLTIDLDVQQAAEKAFAHYGYTGAAVALDPNTGEVLALASVPSFDPNAFVNGIDHAAWRALLTDPRRPLQNRAIQGRYSPGSTFKIAVATAALGEGVVKPSFRVQCAGGASFHGRYFRCWRRGGHGWVDMRRAIEQSCNVYFYTLGNRLGIDRIHKWATRLGLGATSGIDLPHVVRGIVPSTAWKKLTTGQRWYRGETISVAIGQGPVSVTPIELAVMMSTIANGGTRLVPHLLKAVDEGRGWRPVPAQAAGPVLDVPPPALEAVRRGLWLVVNGAGTGGRGRLEHYDVAGKTGTAQVISVEGAERAGEQTARDLRDHGWFVFFAPADRPQIAGVVFAEHSEHGYLAAPIAKYMMQVFFAKQERRPLPTLPPTPALVADGATGDLDD
ncbi:MAG: penicillin-binding protein 2 [Luteitalea sp.]|nr:penicillin-binding protein 2 [Luteitalea sp.]